MKKSFIEKIGEKLPDINILFLMLTIIVLICSFLFQGTYKFGNLPEVVVNNYLSINGFRKIISEMTHNFISFSPLALVLISVIGTGVAEKTGFFGALIRKLGSNISSKLLIPIIIFLGIMSSIASDVGYIVLLPLAGILFMGFGKNPIVGIIAAFAGVSAGFGANLFPTPGDALLGGITIDAVMANDINLGYGIVTMNLIFMIASTFLLAFVGWFVTVKFVEPFFENRKFIVPDEFIEDQKVKNTKDEDKALKASLIAFIIYLIVLVVLYFMGVFTYQVDANGQIIQSGMQVEGAKTVNLLLDQLMVFMVLGFLIPGIVYGVKVKKITSSKDYIDMTVEGFKDNAYVILIAFFAGNFITIFNQTGLGQLIATGGAQFLESSGLNQYPIVLLCAFVFLTAFINLFMGSASAKWILLAPIFIPLLYNANNSLTPEIVQAAYRIADSSTNIISPLMTYMPIIIILVQKFDKSFNIGTMIKIMSKYSIFFLISWLILFFVFYLLQIPFGI